MIAPAGEHTGAIQAIENWRRRSLTLYTSNYGVKNRNVWERSFAYHRVEWKQLLHDLGARNVDMLHHSAVICTFCFLVFVHQGYHWNSPSYCDCLSWPVYIWGAQMALWRSQSADRWSNPLVTLVVPIPAEWYSPQNLGIPNILWGRHLFASLFCAQEIPWMAWRRAKKKGSEANQSILNHTVLALYQLISYTYNPIEIECIIP